MTYYQNEVPPFSGEGIGEELASVYETELEALSYRSCDAILTNGGGSL